MATYSAYSSDQRLRLRALACVAAASFFAGISGCATQSKPASKASVPASEVKIYQTPDLLRNQYTLIGHVWTDSWHSNLSFPSYRTEADGVEAMKRAAADAGANALINVICLDARSKPSESLKLYCYGDAIRVN
jgi:hypothetical protein